jgi:hypothetical protein
VHGERESVTSTSAYEVYAAGIVPGEGTAGADASAPEVRTVRA